MTIDRIERIYISEAAKLLNRRPHTLRAWGYSKKFPQALQPYRSVDNRRFWTAEQIKAILEWISQEDFRPGSGLPHYKPTHEEIDKHLRNIRSRKSGQR